MHSFFFLLVVWKDVGTWQKDLPSSLNLTRLIISEKKSLRISLSFDNQQGIEKILTVRRGKIHENAGIHKS
jgi:hypothetical protein